MRTVLGKHNSTQLLSWKRTKLGLKFKAISLWATLFPSPPFLGPSFAQFSFSFSTLKSYSLCWEPCPFPQGQHLNMLRLLVSSKSCCPFMSSSHCQSFSTSPLLLSWATWTWELLPFPLTVYTLLDLLSLSSTPVMPPAWFSPGLSRTPHPRVAGTQMSSSRWIPPHIRGAGPLSSWNTDFSPFHLNVKILVDIFHLYNILAP